MPFYSRGKKANGGLEAKPLATVTILLAAIRDFFAGRGDDLNVDSIEREFLNTIDRTARQRVPRLTLNVDDNEFFRKRIISAFRDPERQVKPARESHKRIEQARKMAEKHIQGITRNHGEQAKTEAMLHWVEFLADGAQVILLTVPDHLNAFRMFETLNDRGVKSTKADLLKNYLFGEAGDRIGEAQHKWSAMTGTLESVDVDDVVLTYLRHLLVAKHGATREREVYKKIKDTVAGPYPTIQLLDDLADNANNYVALINKHHPYWNNYGSSAGKIRRAIETLNELNVAQIRPLMLACVKSFTHREVEKAFRMFVSWPVRFMIAGTPTGVVEKHYAGRAAEVWKGQIKDAAALAAAMRKHVPDDEVFENAFATARVSKSYLARYLLRSLEQKVKRDPEPEFVVNDDPNILNLEHILPENPGAGWGNIPPETAAAFYRRLGNLVLLKASANSKIGNNSFGEKKAAYKASSGLELTRQVLEYDQWGREEIAERQKRLARIAVETWPLGS